MKVKYLQETHDSKIGEIKEVQDLQANILIQLGFAEKHLEKQAKTDKKA